MEERTRPDADQLFVRFVRALHDWEQAELAAAAGLDPNTIWRYEHGVTRPQGKNRERLLAAAGLPGSFVDGVLRPAFKAALAASTSFEDETFAEGDQAGTALAEALSGSARSTVALFLSSLEADRRRPWERSGPPSEADRLEAADAWERLKTCTAEERRFLVEVCREFQSWVLAERLCHESEKAASDTGDAALELAELACRVAELAPAEKAWRSRLRGYALAYLANARRVAGDLQGAKETFARAWKLWREGAAAEPDLLAEWRLLDLEASLRRADRKFAEALDLHDRARAAAPRETHGRILLKKSATYQQQGESERAIETLREAAPLVDRGRDPHLLFTLRFNLATTLCDLGRHTEAEPLLPEVRDLAVDLQNELDLVRVVWLTGKVAAGLGRDGQARQAFEQARQDFTDRKMAYDCALVSLDLATLHLQQGRTAEVKRLAEEMLWIFKAQGIQREALAALRLFCDAARKEAATVEMARRAGEALGKVGRGAGAPGER